MSTTNGPNVHSREASTTNPESPRDESTELQDLDALVDAFALALKAKLHQKYAEGFRGWNKRWFDLDQIKQHLWEHIDKGDPIDIANYALFWWYKITTEGS